MRAFEIVIAILVALAVIAVLKVIGLMLKFALIAGALGFVAGFLIARAFRARTG